MVFANIQQILSSSTEQDLVWDRLIKSVYQYDRLFNQVSLGVYHDKNEDDAANYPFTSLDSRKIRFYLASDWVGCPLRSQVHVFWPRLLIRLTVLVTVPVKRCLCCLP